MAAGAAAPPRRPHGGHSSRRFKALKAQLAARFDLNHLKEPHPEYTALLWATLASHVALFAGCVLAPSAGHAWARHSALGLTTTWLGGFAHNGAGPHSNPTPLSQPEDTAQIRTPTVTNPYPNPNP